VTQEEEFMTAPLPSGRLIVSFERDGDERQHFIAENGRRARHKLVEIILSLPEMRPGDIIMVKAE
jgi:hypothetical protein